MGAEVGGVDAAERALAAADGVRTAPTMKASDKVGSMGLGGRDQVPEVRDGARAKSGARLPRKAATPSRPSAEAAAAASAPASRSR